ncbi:MAG: hypothetical protein ACE366_06810 [Bradymonadia bacterium]
MRRPLAFLAALLVACAASTAHSKCSSSGVWTWPASGATVPPQPLIAITGYANDKGVALDAIKRVRLIDQKGKAQSLKVVSVHAEGYRTAQVILTPTQPLKAGGRYRVQTKREKYVYDEKTNTGRQVMQGFKTLRTYDAEAGEERPVKWTVGAAFEGDAPRWTLKPTDQVLGRTEFGCGPAMGPGEDGRGMAAGAAGEGPIAFRVTLEAKVGGAPAQTALVVPNEGNVQVGHGMCSGTFQLDSKQAYSVTLAPIDLQGREGPAHEITMAP